MNSAGAVGRSQQGYGAEKGLDDDHLMGLSGCGRSASHFLALAP